jgi:hypothetical protein
VDFCELFCGRFRVLAIRPARDSGNSTEGESSCSGSLVRGHGLAEPGLALVGQCRLPRGPLTTRSLPWRWRHHWSERRQLLRPRKRHLRAQGARPLLRLSAQRRVRRPLGRGPRPRRMRAPRLESSRRRGSRLPRPRAPTPLARMRRGPRSALSRRVSPRRRPWAFLFASLAIASRELTRWATVPFIVPASLLKFYKSV